MKWKNVRSLRGPDFTEQSAQRSFCTRTCPSKERAGHQENQRPEQRRQPRIRGTVLDLNLSHPHKRVAQESVHQEERERQATEEGKDLAERARPRCNESEQRNGYYDEGES